MKQIISFLLILTILLTTLVLAQEELTNEELELLMQDPEIAALLEQNPDILSYLGTGEEFTSAEDTQRFIIQSSLNQMKEDWNANHEQLPGIIIFMFGNENVNIYLEGEILAGIKLEKGYITEINQEGLEKPSINMYLTKEFIDKLTTGESDLLQALQDGTIKIEGEGLVTKMKLWVTSNIMKLLMKFM